MLPTTHMYPTFNRRGMSLAPWPSRTRGGGVDPVAAPSLPPSPPPPSPSPVAATTSRRRKRALSPPTAGQEDSDNDDHDVPELTDVAAALALLVRRFYPSPGPPAACPVVLHHQLYTVLDDHTAVDVELETLRRQNFVRQLRLLTLRQDVGVLLTSTYLARVQAAMDVYHQKQQQAEKEDAPRKKEANGGGGGGIAPHDMVFALRFFQRAVRAFTSLSVTRRQLQVLLDDGTLAIPLGLGQKLQPPPPRGSGIPNRQQHPKGAAMPPPDPLEVVLRLLLKAGFLARRVDSRLEEAYWFSAPELGSMTAALPHGRKAILAALRRSRYKELSERNLKVLELKQTTLSCDFLCADLVGSKEVLAVPTSSGLFLKLLPGSAGGGKTGR